MGGHPVGTQDEGVAKGRGGEVGEGGRGRGRGRGVGVGVGVRGRRGSLNIDESIIPRQIPLNSEYGYLQSRRERWADEEEEMEEKEEKEEKEGKEEEKEE
ncbi:hypothetical protein HZH68_008191 [Vespula germanica]|uniref:Uncharacterized protein n=1 Tax=Vespula germanica TaxID=30212 RepID=A0A834K777_VESGE|nr:hypothetical protein HZH68_008191 [Vespula germanica]